MASSDFWPSCGTAVLGPSPAKELAGCILNGLAGIRTQGLCLAKAALYQLSYKPFVQLPSSIKSNSKLDAYLVLATFQLRPERAFYVRR